MIVLTRLNGQVIALNPDLVTRIDVTPDTTITLLNGDKVIAKETLDQVIARILDFRRAIRADSTAGDAYPPSASVLHGASWGRDDDPDSEPGDRLTSRPRRQD